MMKLRFLFLIFAVVVTSFGWSQDKELKAYLKESQMYSPKIGNYIEIQLNFVGYTLNYITQDSSIYAELEISQTFSQNDSTVFYDHYLLKSPPIIDSIVDDFYDIQNYPLSPGQYTYSLSIKDINSDHKPVEVSKSLDVKDLSGNVTFSSFFQAQTIRPNTSGNTIFTKTGYDVIPMLGNYYPTEAQNLLYYIEAYNTNTITDDSVYVVEQKIIGQDTNVDLTSYTRYFRYKNAPLQPIAKVIDIGLLPTGSYTLQLNLINREKKILARTAFDFDRNNKDAVNEVAYKSIVLDPAFLESIPKDSTGYYVASLIPISRPAEVKNIIRLLKEKDGKKNSQYLQAYWKQAYPGNPYEGWAKYKAQVQLVQRLYATNYQVGFETDRGRVYLQYGSPNSVIRNPSSPSEYPYEIWQYDKIDHYSNRRFVFYSPTNLNKDYRLLHSDMIGELQNPRWQYILNKRNTPGNNLDDPTGGAPSHFGGNSSLYYNTY